MQIDTLKKYVINLKRRPDRLLNFYEIFPFYDYEIVYGFDGRNYDKETAEERDMFDIFPNNLTPGEKGAFISHLRIYKDMVEKNIPYAMILEDDPILCENFKERITKVVEELPTNFNIFYFGGRFTPEFKMIGDSYIRVTENITAYPNLAYLRHNWNDLEHDRGLYSYIISNALAKELLRRFDLREMIGIAIDHWVLKTCVISDMLTLHSNPLLTHSLATATDSECKLYNYALELNS